VNGRYHGTVTIPGATNLGTPIYSVQGKPLTIPIYPSSDPACGSPNTLHLQLGYTDDGYGDNGYAHHDDGDFNQCGSDSIWPFANHGSPARVAVTVQHNVAGAIYTAQPYDLVPACIDDNFIFANAHWGWQSGQPVPMNSGNPATSQPTSYDDPDAAQQLFSLGLLGDIALLGGPLGLWFIHNEFDAFTLCDVNRGHRNWSDITYSGRIRWTEKSSAAPIFGDDDYNLDICTEPVGPAGIVAGGLIKDDAQKRVHMEFDAAESIDEFTRHEFRTFWDDLRDDVDRDNENGARPLVDGHLAIVTGLMGDDAVHDENSGSEIHPVHALAVHRDRTRSSPTTFRDRWALFVRNYGDEGECSSLDHYLLLNQYTFRLRPTIDPQFSSFIDGSRTVVNDAQLLAGRASKGAPSNAKFGSPSYFPSASDPAHPDVLVTMDLLDPPEHSWYAGEIEVEWSLTQPIPDLAYLDVTAKDGFCRAPPEPVAAATAASTSSEATEAVMEPEDTARLLWNSLTPEEQADHVAVYDATVPPRPAPQVVPASLSKASSPPLVPEHVPGTTVGPPTAYKIAQGAAVITALCAATHGAPPLAAAGACSSVPPTTLLTTSGGATGNDGWLTTALSVTLAPRDASGSGIAYTEWSFDGLSFARYAGSLQIPEGVTTLFFKSADNAGNVEDVKSRQFMVDTLAPVSAARALQGAAGETRFAYSVQDPVPGSGATVLHASYSSGGGRVPVDAPPPAGELALPTQCEDVEYWGEDAAGNQEAHQRTGDRQPPDLSLSPSSLCLWPPDHRRVRLRLGRDFTAAAADTCDPSPRVKIAGVTSSEPAAGGGSGNSSADVSFSDTAACVRVERAGTGTGRTYSIAVQATDGSGNASTQTILVDVPHSAQQGCATNVEVIPDTAPCE
jgi:hypothetical protein